MLSVGIVGAGGMGNVHARHYLGMDLDLVLYDSDAEKARLMSERLGIAVAGSFDELIRRCDVTDLCVPTPLHLDLGLRAIAAGRAVFIEKPLAGTLEDGAKLVSAADGAGVPLMPGHVVRFFPEFAKGKRLVEDGAVGTPAAARMRRGGGPPRSPWFLDHAQSGGILLDLAVHDFDWLRWTIGEVSHLYARSVGAKTGFGPDYALTTLTFDNGCVAHVESTWMDPGGGRATYEVCGSAGMIQFDSRESPTLRTHAGGKSVAEASLLAADDPYYNELRCFLESVQRGEPPPVSGYDGLMALSIAWAARESAVSGRVTSPARHF